MIRNNKKAQNPKPKISILNTQYLILLLVVLAFNACKKEQKTDTLFQLLDAKQTNIDFNNQITENDSLNIFNSEFIYNGGGVAVGDLNGDGLQDVFFTGNQVDNQLYLNKGNLQFENISQQAGIQKKLGEWSAGVNMLDLNRDGKLDIYVCNTFLKDSTKRKNLLYINQGNQNNVPVFKEMAHEFGIDDANHAANAQFFDYDNDGDLDLFLGINFMDSAYPNQYFEKKKDGSSPNRDELYRNDWDEKLGHSVFKKVSLEAGIKLDGYSHSSLVADFNEDGWLDIYVANDYVTNDLLYINQKNGTFKNEIAQIFKHQAASAMGSDVADINNDGKLDMFTTEMMPYYNKRKKVFLSGNNYNTYINNETYGYEYQFSRNVLQLNQGINPENGLPMYSDIAFLSGVQETEWSWTPLMVDLDNDGWRDIFVTNGFPRDVTDHDFGAFRSSISYLVPEVELQKSIPQIKVPKFAFKNQGNLEFKDFSKQWGLNIPAFTNGAAYSDLDNDGDLDLVLNNMNDKAFVFKNNLDKNKEKPNYLRLQLKGTPNNPDAIGAKITAYFEDKKQTAQVLSGRGYLSSSEQIVHIGLGNASKIDSVIVQWNNKERNKYINVAINQLVSLSFDKNQLTPFAAINAKSLLLEIDKNQVGLAYMNRDSDYIDFNIQRTLPHKYSQYGPSIAVSDVNGDELEDIYISGSSRELGTWFLQTKAGKFVKKTADFKDSADNIEEELGSLLFDADSDGDNDLYLVHGSNQFSKDSPFYQDVLYINDGKGNFKKAQNALPSANACGQSVKAADFDGDGDLDLFVGGRVLPNNYPKPERSFLLRNDSKAKDQPVFTDVTQQVCPELSQIGLVSDALFSDFNNDGKPDLILAGEWMPLSFFENQGGKFQNITQKTGLQDKIGWWTSLCGADFDNDGDMDYVAGNFGQNTYFKCSSNEPLRVYAKDFDDNGLYDSFISCYWRDSLDNRHEYFYHTRDDMVKQLITIRKKFQTYGAFGEAPVPKVFNEKELSGAQILQANHFSSSFIENMGNGQFKLSILPNEAQLAPIYGILPYDVDMDGLLDVMMVGNDYGMELLQGRADAFYGLVLKNMGKNNFQALTAAQSRFVVPKDARALTKVVLSNQAEWILASQNKSDLKVFAANWDKKAVTKSLKFNKNERKAKIYLKNGQTRLFEASWGSGFLSQSANTILSHHLIQKIEFFDKNNQSTRVVENL